MTTAAHRARVATLAGGAALVLLLSACGAQSDADASAAPTAAAPTPTADAPSGHEEPHAEDDHDSETSAVEQPSRTPRLAVSYDGGLAVIDARSLEVVSTLDVDGLNRISPVGNQRHVAVAADGGWSVLDTGTWSGVQAEQGRYFTAEPALHDAIVEAEAPGHVAVHDGFTTLFDDGTGQVTVIAAGEWTAMVDHRDVHWARQYTAGAAHEGVAAMASDGTMLVTEGGEGGATGAMVLDSEDNVIASSDQCPGLQGETAFTGESGEQYMMTGCEDGVLAFHGGDVQKIAAPDDFGRIGNAFSVDGSNVVLGDYDTEAEGGIGLTQAALINPVDESITVIDPFDGADAEYTWRGLARGINGEALALGTDGALRVIDPATGEVVRSIDVIDAWEVPEDGQSPHPALMELEGMAFVTDPASGAIHAVDYLGGEIWNSGVVDIEMNEIVGVTG